MFKLNCRVCEKCIYRKDPDDKICEGCYEPTGVEFDETGKIETDVPVNREYLKKEMDTIVGELKAKTEVTLPTPTLRVKDQNGNISGEVYRCTGMCIQDAMNFASKAPIKRPAFKRYLKEVIHQLEQQLFTYC